MEPFLVFPSFQSKLLHTAYVFIQFDQFRMLFRVESREVFDYVSRFECRSFTTAPGALAEQIMHVVGEYDRLGKAK